MAPASCPPSSFGREFGLWTCLPFAWLDLLPLVTFVLGGAFELWQLRRKSERHRDGRKLLWSKLALAGCVAALQVAILLVDFVRRQRWDVQLSTELLRPIASAASLFLHIAAFYKLKRSSSALLFFWLFSFSVDSFKIRSALLSHSKVLLALHVTNLLAEVVVFCLECIGPEGDSPYIALPLDSEDADYSGREAPIEKANIFSCVACGPTSACPLMSCAVA
jgi:hypothetical protein